MKPLEVPQIECHCDGKWNLMVTTGGVEITCGFKKLQGVRYYLNFRSFTDSPVYAGDKVDLLITTASGAYLVVEATCVRKVTFAPKRIFPQPLFCYTFRSSAPDIVPL